MSRRSGTLLLDLLLSNKGISPLSHLKMIFNANSFSLQVDPDAFEGVLLEAGGSLETSLAVSTGGVFAPMIPINSMCLRSLPVQVFRLRSRLYLAWCTF